MGGLVHDALGWLYPERCELCLRIGRPAICAECEAEFVLKSDPVERNVPGGPLDLAASVYLFDGRAAEAVKRLKYSRATALAAPMSKMLADASELLALPDFDAIVPVPIHWQRRCRRGFNQSELLVEGMPREKVKGSLLRRIKSTRPQVGLSREERLSNLKGAFLASLEARGKRVLLVDDVRTSGGTAIACAEALKQSGAVYVGILTLCGERTQASGERSP